MKVQWTTEVDHPMSGKKVHLGKFKGALGADRIAKGISERPKLPLRRQGG